MGKTIAKPVHEDITYDEMYDNMELVNDGYTDIKKYGIAFYKKDCMIKKFLEDKKYKL